MGHGMSHLVIMIAATAPTKAATDVLTPSIGRDDGGTSST